MENLRNFIIENRITDLIDIFVKLPKTLNNIESLSLLYRLTEEFDEESNLLYSNQFFKSEYLTQRLNWQKLSIFDKCVPRKPFHQEKGENSLPKKSTIQQMCFAIGANSTRFESMIQCIESLKATKMYQSVPICIMDGGLKDSQRQYLNDKFKIHNLTDLNSIKCMQNMKINLVRKVILGRCFLNKIFPGFRYYFFLDADTWVHDERALDRFILLTEKQGISTFLINWSTYRNYTWFRNKVLLLEDSEIIADKPFINAGIFCIDANDKWFDLLQKYIYKVFSSYKFVDGLDEALITYIQHTNNITEFTSIKDHFIPWYQIPVIRNQNNHYLYIFDQNKEYPVGILHVGGRLIGDYYYFPTINIEGELTPQIWKDHNKFSLPVINQFAKNHKLNPLKIAQGSARISIQYRVYPWQEKNQIYKELITRLENVQN